MNDIQKAVLMGPFVGELYWEAGRFAPMLPYMIQNQYKGQNVKYIILTREERFDLYGKFASILVPLRIPGDYINKNPECFRLLNFTEEEYHLMAKEFRSKYEDRYKILTHLYPDIKKGAFLNKNQYPAAKMSYTFKPRQENYELVEKYLPNGRPVVVLAPRYRAGFKRNWEKWQEFYDLLSKQNNLLNNFHFIVCGRKGEYMPDKKARFFDMNDIPLGDKSSLVGLLLVILEKSFFTFGSQSAIPNLSLLKKVDVLEFGCQKVYHTKTYNVMKTPITFIENKKYDIDPRLILETLTKLLLDKKEKLKI
jgi:hypothetical protein